MKAWNNKRRKIVLVVTILILAIVSLLVYLAVQWQQQRIQDEIDRISYEMFNDWFGIGLTYRDGVNLIQQWEQNGLRSLLDGDVLQVNDDRLLELGNEESNIYNPVLYEDVNLLLDGGFLIVCPTSKQAHPDFDAYRFNNAIIEINNRHMPSGQSVNSSWIVLLSRAAEDEDEN